MTGLRIGRDRVRLYGIGLALIGLTQLRFVRSAGQFWDWVGFYSAGAIAGTSALLDPTAYRNWGAAHAVPVIGFVYMPGFAWFLAPAARLSIPWGFALNAAIMTAAAVVAARLAARIYRLDNATSLYMTVGWAPVTAALVTGQNSPLGLVLSLIAIEGLAGGNDARAGLGIAGLCYKPTYALPFVLLLFIFRKWKALGVVIACGSVWYALSASAAGGDWLWPMAYFRSLAQYVGPDFASNRFKSVSVPGLLILAGVPSGPSFGIGLLALVAALVWLRRVSVFQAASLAGAIGVATSAHAWPYDAALALPALWWTTTNAAEPWRTRVIVAAYAVAPLWLASHALHFDPFAVVVVGGAAAAVLYRGSMATRST